MRTSSVLLAWVGMALLGAAGCSSGGDPTKVGSLAPDFTVLRPGDESKKVDFKDFKGKVVLIDFWATWCGPCKMEMPSIEKLWKSNKSRGVEVMAISDEKAADIQNFAMTEKYELPFYEDAGDLANRAFAVDGYPTTVVIGKDGKIVYYGVGAGPSVADELQTAIDLALK